MSSLKKHAFWLAPILGLFGFLSYFLLFASFPILRDVPVLNLGIVLLAFILSVLGLLSVRGASWKRKLLHGAGLLFSLGSAAMLFLYVFGISNQIPKPTDQTIALKAAPEFSLPDANGETVSLSSYRGKKVILSFYRGFW